MREEETVEKKETEVKNRLEYLYDEFNVQDLTKRVVEEVNKYKEEGDEFDTTEVKGFTEGIFNFLTAYNENYKIVLNKKFVPVAMYIPHEEDKDEVVIDNTAFEDIVEADPTPTKHYVQWMLNKFVNMVKGKKKKDGGHFTIYDARSFIEEDLPNTKRHLEIFENNKRKKKFKKLAKNSTTLSHITDPSDINQYEDLSQLFDAVDPFIEGADSDLENTMQKYEKANEAEIEFRDRFFTVYVPKTQGACTVFKDHANWCNLNPEGTMFDSYVQQKRPNGEPSKMYIIVNNDVFKGESKELYQIHFESKQIKSRRDEINNVNIHEPVIQKSKGVADYFYNELYQLAKDYQKYNNGASIEDNIYIDYLLEFGFSETLFDFLEKGNTPHLTITKKKIVNLPDLSKFKDELQDLNIQSETLKEVHPNIGNLKNLKILILKDTKIESLPKSIGNLKSLQILSLYGSKELKDIPDEIGNLDPANGGSLEFVIIEEDSPLRNKISKLLPNVFIDKSMNLGF